MMKASLDDTIKKALNELTIEEVSRSVSYAYEHEILWYGIDAVAQIYLLQMAKDISKDKISLNTFIEKYELKFKDKYKYCGFDASLKKIEDDGIFIPWHAYYDITDKNLYERKLRFFDFDHGNRIGKHELQERKWQSNDLENLKLVEQGVKYGEDIWKTCIDGFERYKFKIFELPGVLKPRKVQQPQKITELGDKLIEYYSAVVYELKSS